MKHIKTLYTIYTVIIILLFIVTLQPIKNNVVYKSSTSLADYAHIISDESISENNLTIKSKEILQLFYGKIDFSDYSISINDYSYNGEKIIYLDFIHNKKEDNFYSITYDSNSGDVISISALPAKESYNDSLLNEDELTKLSSDYIYKIPISNINDFKHTQNLLKSDNLFISYYENKYNNSTILLTLDSSTGEFLSFYCLNINNNL